MTEGEILGRPTRQGTAASPVPPLARAILVSPRARDEFVPTSLSRLNGTRIRWLPLNPFVSQPSNTNCMVARSMAPDVPQEHWFALNQVIRMRAISLIAEKVGVPPSQVSRVVVWGNNSETALIDLHPARIGDRPALEVI